MTELTVRAHLQAAIACFPDDMHDGWEIAVANHIQAAIDAGRWEGFSVNELRVVIRGLRNVDVHWVDSATLDTVKKMRRIRNHRDAMVLEVQGEIERRFDERASA